MARGYMLYPFDRECYLSFSLPLSLSINVPDGIDEEGGVSLAWSLQHYPCMRLRIQSLDLFPLAVVVGLLNFFFSLRTITFESGESWQGYSCVLRGLLCSGVSAAPRA